MTTAQKTCFKCKSAKPLTDFYRHPMMADGRLGKCKECTKQDVTGNYRNNRDYYRDYDRKRAMLPHRVEARKIYAQTPRGRERLNAGKRAYLERNPQKRAARIACGNAIRDGRLLREPCQVCGALIAQAHHDDYTKPLDVRWLCVKHHTEHHRKQRIAA